MSLDGARRSEWGSAAETSTLLMFGGHLFEPLLSGALFWRAQRTLLVADLHLEKLSSFARRGQLLPPYDTGATLRRLRKDIEETGATRVIALGDSFHRDEGTSTLLEADRMLLDGLVEQAEWIWLLGNHDPAPHRLGGQCLSHFVHCGLTLTHEPRSGVPGLVGGHLHPAAAIHVAGRTVRRPCFVHDGKMLVMPAYGSSTGSINILGAAFSSLFDFGSLEVTMLGRDRLYPVSPRRLVAW